MSDKPILFSGPMVRAMLEGRKTQTRRVAKITAVMGDKVGITSPDESLIELEDGEFRRGIFHYLSTCGLSGPYKLPYTVGDRLFPSMPIPSLNRNYCADLYGRIWSRAKDDETWVPLKGSPTSRGYLSVTPANEGRYRTRLVHRLVAEAFYGSNPVGMNQVRHLNGEQTDNSPENLDWGTQEDNWSDRLAHGRGAGERHHAAKLTAETVEEIRASSLPQRAIANRFGVAQSTVWAIRNGRYWQESPQPNPPNCHRWASRLTLTVTDVRVQRLLDISDEDARAEGAPVWWRSLPEDQRNPTYTATGMFRDLWNSINAKRGFGWDENPWVAAYTFTVEKG